VSLPDAGAQRAETIRLRLKSASGRRVIAREDRGRRAVRYALGPDATSAPERGQARDQLLSWITDIERQRGVTVKDLHWDGDTSYWLELEGDRVPYPSPIAPLEFKE
jgi:hypothetical protein